LGLLCRCCPSDVARFVVSIRINAVKRETWRAFADLGKDIGEESNKGLPPFAYGDAASAVILVILMIGVDTTLMHRTPSAIERMSTFAFGVAMSDVATSETSTRTSVAALEKMTSNDGLISAVALAKPEYSAFWRSTGLFDCYEKTETVIRYIKSLGHRAVPSVRGQVAGSVRKHRPAAHYSIVRMAYHMEDDFEPQKKNGR
jgi:hypothetical protein